MCSIEEPILVKEQAPLSAGKKCIKCKIAKATILIRYSTYCKSCFQHVFVGKFRKNLEKSRVIHSAPDEKAMVALSGGPSSRCLLQLLRDYCEPLPHEISKKSTFNEIKICHVDESVAIFDEQEKEKENSTLCKVESIAKKYNYEFIGLRLEDIFSPEYTSSGLYDNSLLDAVSTLTSKEELLWHFKMCLLMQMARKKGCTRLFMGDCSTRLSIKIISLTSKGRGFSLPLETSGECNLFKAEKHYEFNFLLCQNNKIVNLDSIDVIILRPMKDMLSKEIGIYNQFTGLVDDIVITPTLTSMMSVASSIERLTEDFIVGLEKDYPSTVSTIARTGAKLTPSNLINLEQSCAVCMMPYKEGIKNWQNRITVHMKQPPLAPPSPFTSPSQNSISMDYNNSSCQCASNDTLCYACLVNMRDIKKVVEFPPYVADAILQKIQKATNATIAISPTANRLKYKFFATTNFNNKSLKTDYVGIPDTISNLRPIKYYIPENASPEDTEWRLHRERIDQFNHQFWTSNNELFIVEKQEYENQLKLKTGKKPTSAEISIFYKDFLDKAYDRQMAYNQQWWKENIRMLLPGGKAAIRNFRIWMPKRSRTRISFFEKNASS
ncbi:1985_t:CDS:10 [Ambispora gerdemannii]|uniref:Cytoplasmic tRNA 2-thiolation protein 2 n=1 Tax=Ambispora gerdemannii TaxID=144530 RepID=A0A9N8UXD3_9GLOM|nr:1985_t:CDS:10 [Ambispora gerdemannii]